MSLWGQTRCLDKQQLLRDASGRLLHPPAAQLKRKAWCNRTISAVVSGLGPGSGSEDCRELNGTWICAWTEPSQFCFFGSDFAGGSGPTPGFHMRIYTGVGASLPDGWLMSIVPTAVGGSLIANFNHGLTWKNYPDAWCPIGVWQIDGYDNWGEWKCSAETGAVTTEWAA